MRTGRPKLPDGQKRTVPLRFRVRAEDYKRFKERAEQSNLTLSEWIRNTTVRAARTG